MSLLFIFIIFCGIYAGLYALEERRKSRIVGADGQIIHIPRVIRKRSVAGIVLQLCGLVLVVAGLFSGVFWMIPGIVLLVVGVKLNRTYVCSECRNPVDSKDVKRCPICRAAFYNR